MAKSFAAQLRHVRDPETGIIEFFYDRVHLATEEDVVACFADFDAALADVPKPRDVVICLDGLIVAPAAREVFSEARARVAKNEWRHSARYGGSAATRIAIMASALRHHAKGLVYETREEAFAAILAARQQSADQSRS